MSLKVFRVAEMVAAEKAADALGVSYAQMMETAGQQVAQAILERYPVAGRSVLVLVGPGNNGGDGLVAGRYLAQAGADVAFYLTKMRNPEHDSNFAQVQQMGLFILLASFDQRFRVLRTRLHSSDLVVDALLGTSVSRPISGPLARLMQQVQQGLQERRADAHSQSSTKLISTAAAPTKAALSLLLPVVAVDCPSGLNCDTGELDPLAAAADLTVTFAGPKRGHLRFPGAAACGELVVADIGIPSQVTQEIALELATAVTMRHLLPKRPLDGHKGTFGRVMVAGGSAHYWGAPLLAARAAFRTGAGLVALAVPQVIRATLAGQLPEATYPPIPDAKSHSAASAQWLLDNLSQPDALLLGPGLDEAEAFLMTLLAARHQLPPLVIDADGLNLLARQPYWPQMLPPYTILTPHPAEMARLMGISLADLLVMERVELASQQAQSWGQVVLLKGAYTVVAAPNGRGTILPFANPVLAIGGSGDVLAGVITSLLGQGVSPYEAAVLGGYLHGLAGELANGRLGLLAHELADLIPLAIGRLAG